MELPVKKIRLRLNGSVLKLIAVITMLIDHIAVVFLSTQFDKIAYINILHRNISVFQIYQLMHGIGRIAFPIYCFLLVEGFLHTHDRKKYGISLLVFALVSELPFDLAFYGELTPATQNVFFTLLLGFLGLCAYEMFRDSWKELLLSLFILYVLTLGLNTDYGVKGFGLILLMYVLRENRVLQAVAGCCILSGTWKCIPAFLAINLYNGERGFIKGKALKYTFYAFYPVHLLVLYLIKYRGV